MLGSTLFIPPNILKTLSSRSCVCIAETASFPCVAITLYPLYDRSSPSPSGAISMWVVDQLVDCRTFDTDGEVIVDFGDGGNELRN